MKITITEKTILNGVDNEVKTEIELENDNMILSFLRAGIFRHLDLDLMTKENIKEFE